MPAKRSSKLIMRKLPSGGYILDSVWRCDTDIKGAHAVVDRIGGGRAELFPTGLLVVYPKYIWDGASGPVIDRQSNHKAGLAHDALYHMMRAGQLPVDKYRDHADILFRELVREEGGWAITAWADYIGLQLFAKYAAKKQKEVNEKPIIVP